MTTSTVKTPVVTAKSLGLARCPVCLLLVEVDESVHNYCPRCDSKVHMRIYDSLQRCWALTICSLIAFIPANAFPIMTILYFGKGQPDTILSGVVKLLELGMLCNDSHGHTIRISPPLVITEAEVDYIVERLEKVLVD